MPNYVSETNLTKAIMLEIRLSMKYSIENCRKYEGSQQLEICQTKESNPPILSNKLIKGSNKLIKGSQGFQRMKWIKCNVM